MARRRYKPYAAPKDNRLFADEAIGALKPLAQNVVTATVSPHLAGVELDDVIDALWDKSTVHALREGFKVAVPQHVERYIEHASFGAFGLINSGHDEARLEFDVKMHKADCQVPASGFMKNAMYLDMTPTGHQMNVAIRGFMDVMKDFGTVRKAIKGLEAFMREGQIGLSGVRYLCPWLPQLLSHDHMLQDFKGKIAPDYIPADIREPLRETPGILLSASLAPQSGSKNDGWTLTVHNHPDYLEAETNLLF